MIAMRGRRYAVLGLILAVMTIMMLTNDRPRAMAKEYYEKVADKTKQGPKPKPNSHPTPAYLPEPTWTAPPVQDPFPALSTSTPPPVPEWNVPKKDLHKDYGIDYAPPLLIGFTRSWPILLQAVVSYITAGWPADQIYVVENTGVQWANLRGKLTLQNPFYLNHTQLNMLGVNVIRTPVLMTFAQLQNFFTYTAHEREWPYYFWSHMDVLALSYESGFKGVSTPIGTKGYKSIYEMCLMDMNETLSTPEKWATRFYEFDHLTLVHRDAFDDVGGWDTFIPYYSTDCDMYDRLRMKGYELRFKTAGIINDVNTVFKDLRVLYREPSTSLEWIDPSPPPPDKAAKRDTESDRKEAEAKAAAEKKKKEDEAAAKAAALENESDDLKKWRKLRTVTKEMMSYKKDRQRNTWQTGQKGGQGEPFYYDSRGIAVGMDVVTQAGQNVYKQKWGGIGCSLRSEGGLELDDQWRVEDKSKWSLL